MTRKEPQRKGNLGRRLTMCYSLTEKSRSAPILLLRMSKQKFLDAKEQTYRHFTLRKTKNRNLPKNLKKPIINAQYSDL